jgi:hypothetical protein
VYLAFAVIHSMLGSCFQVTLRAEALQPFVVETYEAEFVLQPDGSRTARAVVTNHAESPQQISVVLPPKVPVERVTAMNIAPGESQEVILRISPETKTRIAPFSVRFQGPDNAVTLNFHAPPVPAELLVVSHPEFGWVETRAAARATLVLSNTGGIALVGRLQMQEGLTVENGVTAFSISPGTAQTIPLKFTPEDGKDLPTDIVILSGGREIPIPILPQGEGDGPFCDISSVYKPSPAGLVLNADVKLQAADGAAYIVFSEGANWTGFTLQHRPEGADEWRNYIMPKPDEGLVAWIRKLIREIRSFTSEPEQVGGLELDEGWGRIAIAASEIDGADVWRLLAVARNRTDKLPATKEFRISSEGLVTLEPCALSGSAILTSSLEIARDAERLVEPVTDMASASIRSGYDSASLQVAFEQSLGVKSLRLEQGAMVATLNNQTGIPMSPSFEKIDPPQASVELLSMAEAESDGKQFTLWSAQISGLSANSRTFWRIIPDGDKGDLPPTNVMLVDTLPAPFAWRHVFPGALGLILVGLLFLLRRKSRQLA